MISTVWIIDRIVNDDAAPEAAPWLQRLAEADSRRGLGCRDEAQLHHDVSLLQQLGHRVVDELGCALAVHLDEVQFFRLLSEHIEEMLPVVYTPTVGLAIERFSHEFRRPRGVYLSVDRPEEAEISLRNTELSAEDVDLLVATDAEGILGIGDQGVGGIEIPR